MSSFIVSFQIQADPPKRLDKALSRDVPEDADISRSQIVRFLEKGAVRVDGVVQSDVKAKVVAGQLVEITIPEAVATETLAQNIPLDVIYEDTDLIVVNKPAGMVVHPAPGSLDQTLVNALLYHCADTLSASVGNATPVSCIALIRIPAGYWLSPKTIRRIMALPPSLKRIRWNAITVPYVTGSLTQMIHACGRSRGQF